MISYEVRQAIEALPGKTVQPWKDGDKPCHCTHCDLCGRLYRTEDITTHAKECEAALLKALASARVVAARLVGGEGNQLVQQLAFALDSAQIQALRAIYGSKAKGGRRVWVGTTWNGMYNGLAGHGLCRVRKMGGGAAARERYEARVTKLGRAVLEAWDK